MGNATEVSVADVQRELAPVLASTETVEKAYRLVRDMFIFTNKRLMLIDKQGLTGKKVEYHSIPYRAITHFSVETAGHFDLEAELSIWVSGTPEPIQRQLSRQISVAELQSVLAEYALR